MLQGSAVFCAVGDQDFAGQYSRRRCEGILGMVDSRQVGRGTSTELAHSVDGNLVARASVSAASRGGAVNSTGDYEVEKAAVHEKRASSPSVVCWPTKGKPTASGGGTKWAVGATNAAHTVITGAPGNARHMRRAKHCAKPQGSALSRARVRWRCMRLGAAVWSRWLPPKSRESATSACTYLVDDAVGSG